MSLKLLNCFVWCGFYCFTCRLLILHAAVNVLEVANR